MDYLNKIVNKLIKESIVAKNKGEIPVAAIICDHDGKVISIGRNNRQVKNNVLAHAEIEAIIKAEKKVKDWRLDGFYMFVSLEPCEMCSMVIKECRIDKVFYLVAKKRKSVYKDFYINKEQVKGYINEKKILTENLIGFFDDKRL